ncbi:MAG TPA: peptidoglycan editing factor PgeF [Terriglobales bacterium]
MAAGSKIKAKTKIDVVRADSLARIRWLMHGFSTRRGGVSKAYGGGALNLGFTPHDARAAVGRNRELFVSAVPSQNQRWKPGTALVTLRQIHSDIIHCISDIPLEPLAGDGLITNRPGLLLAVLTADCLPVIVVDARVRAIGVFHAGWRGTVKRIVEKGVGEMRRHFGSRSADLRAAIGPGIRSCCYQVGPELRDKFESQFSYGSELFRESKERNEIHEKYPLLFLTARAPGHSELPKKIFVDLAGANRRQLVDAGVPAKNITDLGLCTACHLDRFFSHRAENGLTGRMMAAAGIRP